MPSYQQYPFQQYSLYQSFSSMMSTPPATNSQYQGTPLKVSANSKPKSVAGKIAHITRSGPAPTLMAIGPSSINQTVKAIAIARTYLKENKTDLMCFPKFQRLLTSRSGDPGDNRNNLGGSIAFELQKGELQRKELESTSEMKVAQTSEPGPVAGAIAGQIRSGERVSLLSIGPGSVSQTVKAIAIARTYLRDGQMEIQAKTTPGKENYDLSFRPEFIHIPYDDDGRQQQRSAIKFKLFYKQIPQNNA